MDRWTYCCTSRASEGRGSSLTLGASAPIEQFTFFMGILKSKPSACGACEVRGSSPANIQRWSNARIGREVLARLSGQPLSEVIVHSMGGTRSPNKAPEPTAGSVTPRAFERVIELKPQNASRDTARGAPAPAVAHL